MRNTRALSEHISRYRVLLDHTLVHPGVEWIGAVDMSAQTNDDVPLDMDCFFFSFNQDEAMSSNGSPERMDEYA